MRKDAVSKKTTAKIEKLAEGVLKAVASGKNPFLDIPVRSLANVSWSEKRRLVELGNQKQKRYFFNVSMAKKFMQTFLVSEACKELIDSGKTTSIRDLYYVTKHTIGDTQPEHLRGAGRVRPDHRGPRGHGRRAARGAAPLRRAQGLDGRPDHDHRHRRHHRPAAHGLGRLGGALDRRGERHRASASTRPSTSCSSRRTRSGRASTRTSSGSATAASSSRAGASRRAACGGWCSGCTAS